MIARERNGDRLQRNVFHRRLGRAALDITRQVSLPPGGELASQEIVHAQDQRSFTFEV